MLHHREIEDECSFLSVAYHCTSDFSISSSPSHLCFNEVSGLRLSLISKVYNAPIASFTLGGGLIISLRENVTAVMGRRDSGLKQNCKVACKYLKKWESGISQFVFNCLKDPNVPSTYKSLPVLSPFSVHILKAPSVMDGLNTLFLTKRAFLDVSNRKKARLNCVHIFRKCLIIGLWQYVDRGSKRGILEQASACKETCLQEALSSCSHRGSFSFLVEWIQYSMF